MALTTSNSFSLVPGGEAVASGDFTNIATANAADGVYTLNGSSVALDDVINLDHPDSVFDPVANIDAGGIKLTDTGVGFTGINFEVAEPLLSSLLASGFTLVMEAFCQDSVDDAGGAATNLALYLHNADYSQNPSAAMSCNNFTDLTAISGNDYFNNTDKVVPSNQVSKVAVTVTNARCAVSINGGAVGAIEEAMIDGDTTNVNFNIGGGGGARLRSFAFYDVVDDADLPALSA